MRVAILQTAGKTGDVKANLERLAVKVGEAASLGARIVVCPELYLTGYNVDTPTMTRLAEAEDGPSAQRICDIARSNSIAILYGYAERDGDTVYNSAQLIDSDGRSLANCRKTHLFGELEQSSFTPGESLLCTRLDDVPVGMLICYDIELPEPARALALAGASVVLVPTALSKPYEFVAKTLIAARAWENQIFVVYADRCGSEGDLDYVGFSTVAGPDGRIIAQAGESESLLIADIDLSEIERVRSLFSYLDDRRPELYRHPAVRTAKIKEST